MLLPVPTEELGLILLLVILVVLLGIGAFVLFGWRATAKRGSASHDNAQDDTNKTDEKETKT